MTLGACAPHGGIQGLRNFGSRNVENALAIVAMAQARPEFADKLRDALQLKKAGNAIVDLKLRVVGP